MEIIQFVRAVWRRWWLVAIGGALGLVIAYGISTTAPKQYESTVTLQLNPSARSAFLPFSDALGGGANPVTGLAASYSEILRSRSFAELVIKNLDLSVPPEAISGAINARLVSNTNIMRLTVQWDNAHDAQSLAQAVAELFISENLKRQQTQPGAESELSAMQKIVAEYPSRIEAIRHQRDKLDQAVGRGDLSRLSELNSLDSRLATLESSYTSLLVSIQQAQSQLDTASILDSAGPAQPVGPPGLTRALPFGLAAGVGAAIALVMFLDSVDDTLRSPADLAGAVGAGPLAVIGYIQSRRWSREARRSRLATLHAWRSGPAEAFRTLRANLRLMAADHPLRTLVVTSPSAAEGKTVVASNLAIAFAQAGDRTLLVDADLRRPSLHETFDTSLAPGLSELLTRREATASAVQGQPPAAATLTGPGPRPPELQPAAALSGGSGAADPRPPLSGVVASTMENLWVLPAGAIVRDPTRLLDSQALARVIEEAKARWDLIIFDTAPLGPVADTLALASQADATLLVTRADHTRRGQLDSTVDALQKTGKPVIGVIFNGYQPDLFTRYTPYASYYHSYGYSGHEETNGHTSNGHA